MDACRSPTGVTRHALAQIDRLRNRGGIELFGLGRMTSRTDQAYRESLRTAASLRTRDALRWWRLTHWPPVEWWTGPVDWLYCPAEYGVPRRQARLAVTSHDVLQNLRFNPGASASPARTRDWLARTFAGADLILSVSHFNTARLRVLSRVSRPGIRSNAAEDLFLSRPRLCQRRDAFRPGSAAGGSVRTLGGQFPAPQEPCPADPCVGPGAGDRARGAGAGAARQRHGGGGARSSPRSSALIGGCLRLPGYRQGRACARPMRSRRLVLLSLMRRISAFR